MEFLLLYGGAALLAAIGIGSWLLRRDEAARSGPPVPPALIRISQPAAGYPLVWEINGQRYRTIDEIEDDAHRALAIAAVRQLMHQLPPEAMAPLFPEPAEASAMATGPESPPQAVHLASFQSPPTPSRAEPISLDEDIYRQPFWKRFKESLFDSAPPSPPPGPSPFERSEGMLKEIDDLFQEYLRRLPDAPEAFVRPAPGGGMQIIVAGRAYQSPDAIPYPEIAAALRQAIKAWEARI